MAGHIYHVRVRNSLGRGALEDGHFLSPFGGAYADKPVVRSVELLDEGAREAERRNVTQGLVDFARRALIENAVDIRGRFVQLRTFGGAQIFDRREKIGGFVTEFAKCGIIGVRNGVLKIYGSFPDEPFGEFAASVRRVYRRQRRNIFVKTEVGYRISRIKAAFRMCNYIDFFRSRFLRRFF